MRFVHFTDLHLSARHPRSRKDDYTETVLSKLQFIAATAAADCDAVLCTGDFFDRTNEPLELIERAREIIDRSGLAWYFIAGQHELEGYNEETLESSSLGRLVARCPHCQEPKFSTVCANAFLVPSTGLEIGPLTLVGFNAGRIPKIYGSEEWTNIKADILMLHEMIVPRPVQWDHMLASEIQAPDGCRLILCGDYHGAFSAKTANGVLLANPGAVARKNLPDANRTPRIWKFTSNKEGPPTDIKPIEVPHQPAREVLKIDEARTKALVDIDLSSFESSVSNLAEVLSTGNPEKVLQSIVSAGALEDDDRDSILSIAKKHLTEVVEKQRSK